MGKKIRVLYDELGFREAHGGVSRYFTELIKHLPENVEGRCSAVCSNNSYLQAPPFSLPRMSQDVQSFIRSTLHGHSFPGVSHVYRVCAKLFPRLFPSGELQNRRAFAAKVAKGDFDILHITDPHPYFNCWKPVLGKKPIVATVHDLIPELFQNNIRVRWVREQLMRDASHIIVVSQNTKNDLIRLYHVPDEKISVIYHGYLPLHGCVKPLGELTCQPATPNYLLFVGKRDGYKNFDFFIRAVAPLLQNDKSLSVFCTGLTFNANEKALFASLGIESQVAQGFVPDDEMPSVFAHALAFVYPSRYEGFGIPILDAFAAGCPVVLANASCFPEVAGDAALYFAPSDLASLRDQFARLLHDVSLRDRLVVRSRLRLECFSWSRCAEETANIYRELMCDMGTILVGSHKV